MPFFFQQCIACLLANRRAVYFHMSLYNFFSLDFFSFLLSCTFFFFSFFGHDSMLYDTTRHTVIQSHLVSVDPAIVLSHRYTDENFGDQFVPTKLFPLNTGTGRPGNRRRFRNTIGKTREFVYRYYDDGFSEGLQRKMKKDKTNKVKLLLDYCGFWTKNGPKCRGEPNFVVFCLTKACLL